MPDTDRTRPRIEKRAQRLGIVCNHGMDGEKKEEMT
jgi:hypothetical protein